MADNVVECFGWESAEGPESCGIITPKVLSLFGGLGGVKRMLDLGSGNGKLCSELARAGYYVVGTEFDRLGVAIAKSNYPGISFYNYGIQDDPRLLLSQEKPFDAVVSTEVIEHLFSPHLLPRYAAAVLKEGGYLLITTPYHGYLKNLALSVFDKWDFHHTALRHGGHIKFWSRATLTELLSQNSFRVIAFGGVGRFPYLWNSMVLLAQKGIETLCQRISSNSVALRLSSCFDLDHQTPYHLTPPTWIDAVGLRYERFVLRLGKGPASAAAIATSSWEPSFCLTISLPR